LTEFGIPVTQNDMYAFFLKERGCNSIQSGTADCVNNSYTEHVANQLG